MKLWSRILLLVIAAAPFITEAQAPNAAVQPIRSAPRPLPSEEASANITKFSFAVYGDTRGRSDGTEIQSEHQLVVNGMLSAFRRLETTEYPVRFILGTGDAVANGSDARQWNTSFIPVVNRLVSEGGAPLYLVPGNHDVLAPQNTGAVQRQQSLRNFLQAMSLSIPADASPRRLAEYPTYAFGYGNTFVLALDSNIADDETQYNWVKKQLEELDSNRYVNIVAFLHQPVFSSGPHGGPRPEAQSLALRTRYMPLFREHHVKAVFSGHDHLFEHWVERYTDAAGPHRMDLITTGGGGAPLYGYRGEPDLTDYLRANQASRVSVEHLAKPGPDPGDNPYHFVMVRVDGEHLRIQAVGVDFGATWRPYRSNSVELNDPD